jgi:hypothetical protein
MTPPQKVTSRYIRNLLIKGKNNEFEILGMKRDYSMIDGICVGHYFMIDTKGVGGRFSAAGATPEQALQRALEKHGVTFR